MSTNNHPTGSVFRVDKFVVPAEARDEILSKVFMTHELLRRQEAFVQDFLLEQFSGPGEFNIVTMVEWESQAAIDKVVPIVKAAHERIAFSAQETIARLGVKADIANYRRVPEV
ncbi:MULTISPECIES: antibiotic biosynthesis monooxygenase [unclassified Mesorhizobium]|uniref:antibiotic biosynthesis monooxygenase n=1 Tax=unclassified Mesorhizobium TaxID=325217 RepID=UPI000F7641A0|nr:MULTISPECIES: antibiotic biosynthesis monooxygenase [unclassified Mesorhizobium]AZO06203.1 antibiotic biosynthesis monooxygenase [Mesorhizobium sp. M2A.F.Ca.ET.043.02.1.1]RUW33706.1 antibiotic biosynthesis monooxygenase [Mesorhizobium sp. M2A.F.Ca.ET.015.02.1.1]RUW69594.1 antibiotic biosynthesis monooxygenase [Mesorhizobium sp. M2A.F.Ca.ET.067.02.1.1]RVC91416.1 antibiotic biosynthesis monooxygenase [Mesorhizobium sp. M2A.F.Ca.ET.017.03.2.1]RVC91898.1 antibiotic biosynthesis monooxygenase [M